MRYNINLINIKLMTRTESESNYYYQLRGAARYFFDLNLSYLTDQFTNLICQIVFYLAHQLIKTFKFLDLTQYIDHQEVQNIHNENKNNPTLPAFWNSSIKRLNFVPSYISSYSVFVPIVFEVWHMFYASPLIRLWILGSFSVTFLCIWSIVWNRDVVSQYVCQILNLTPSTFDLNDFIRIGGFISIIISIFVLSEALWTLDLIGCLISLSVSNRMYRNVQSYLTIMNSDKV